MSRQRVLLAATSHTTYPGSKKRSGANLKQLIYAAKGFEYADYDVDIVTSIGGRLAVDPATRDIVDPICRDYLEQARFLEKLEATRQPSEIAVGAYSALLCIGGAAALWDFREDEGLRALVRDSYREQSYIGAVGCGTALLCAASDDTGASLLAGKSVTGMTYEEQEALGLGELWPYILEEAIEQKAGIFVKNSIWQEKVVVDGHLFTGQNTHSTITVVNQMIEAMRQEPSG